VLKSREITIVGEMPDLYVIKSGLSKDKIVLDGVQKAKDDEKINYVYQSQRWFCSFELK
jgi:membrane fusion protein (multidrug efflux system)